LNFDRSFFQQNQKGQIFAPILTIKLEASFQMIDLSVLDESPCPQTSKRKISAYLNISMENAERPIFGYFI
jgi:hypothetical protein